MLASFLGVIAWAAAAYASISAAYIALRLIAARDGGANPFPLDDADRPPIPISGPRRAPFRSARRAGQPHYAGRGVE